MTAQVQIDELWPRVTNSIYHIIDFIDEEFKINVNIDYLKKIFKYVFKTIVCIFVYLQELLRTIISLSFYTALARLGAIEGTGGGVPLHPEREGVIGQFSRSQKKKKQKYILGFLMLVGNLA